MIVRVEATWDGSRDGHGFRLTMPDGRRESVRGEAWDRKTASQALDLLEHVYHVKRGAVRFDVHA